MLKSEFNTEPIQRTARIASMVDDLLGAVPEIEADRAVLITRATGRQKVNLLLQGVRRHLRIYLRTFQLYCGTRNSLQEARQRSLEAVRCFLSFPMSGWRRNLTP